MNVHVNELGVDVIRERLLQIGTPRPLVAVLTEPDDCPNGRTAVILLNSGVMHRVGACRFSVQIARALSTRRGLPCLRFDFSGIGDSAPRGSGGIDFDANAVREVREVMDHLQSAYRIERFILYGLCSGALIACKAAERDERVTAIAQIDGCCYPTAKAYLSYYLERLLSAQRWQRRIDKWCGHLSGKSRRRESREASEDFLVPEFAADPGRRRVARQLQTLMERGVDLHCVFTGRELSYRYESQFRDCFHSVDFGKRLSLHYLPRASHILTEPQYRREVLSGLLDWVKQVTTEARRGAPSDDLSEPALDFRHSQYPSRLETTDPSGSGN